MKSVWMVVLVLFLSVAINGCIITPYHAPVFNTIKNNETAFVIPLDGDTKNQAKFFSEEYLNSAKVAKKRVELPHRFVKKGRSITPWINGEWIPTIDVLVVNRSPITCEWTGDPSSGTEKKNQALSAESKDSIGVSSGFCLTAWIEEVDASTFLYKFQTSGLATVVNGPIRQTIQAEYTNNCSKYNLNELREMKEEITAAIRAVVIPKYKAMGITIDPSLGLVGGFEYENKNIQTAIDQVFIDQQLQRSAKAKMESQATENKTLLGIRTNEAEMAKAQAIGEANAIREKAKGEANAIKEVAKALADAGPAYLTLKEIEVKKAAAILWDGKTPNILSVGSDGNMMQHLMLNK